ncbi:MAG: 30S ribosomal protein S8 [Candidatus Microsyncoccus archaeolyticus]|jgi:small subunit ribosomal protein S8|nr:MAG: 30S ribosomal protein S8 [Candidatus Parcubacteria bacterium]
MDPVADMISSINNANAVSKKQIAIFPYSDFKYAILEILKKEGMIEEIEKKGRLSGKRIIVTLKYNDKGEGVLTKIKLISKQGQRIYRQVKEIKKVKSGHGFAILSSSKGLITDKDAKKMKIGGELICEVW